MTRADKPTFTVIIPVHNGGEKFTRCMEALAACAPAPDEIIVVADGESDGSWRTAERFGARIVRMEVSGGPARARNAGARVARGELLLFIDADVVVPGDILAVAARAFEADPGIAAVFGSYDDAPLEANFLSQYKNLAHYHVHQSSHAEASTFWSGCGAIRRELFLGIGGFDERYRLPSIEDIELGYRITAAGHRIRLVKELAVKHLKRWDAVSLVKTDFLCRALPWTELILRRGRFINDLNLTTESRISVAATGLLALCLAAAPFWPALLALALAPCGLLLALNRDLYRFFLRKKGALFTAQAIPWHWLYFGYSGLAFSIGFVRYHAQRLRKRG